MVVIDENDVGKTQEEVLMDLIYEQFGHRIPLDKIKFGKPREVDARKDLWWDANTFIPARIDQAYDDRFSGANNGFMYRRRSMAYHFTKYDFSGVIVPHLPIKLSELLPQINAILPYPLEERDVVDKTYTSIEEVEAGITLEANPESLLWCKGHDFVPNTTVLEGIAILDITDLPGFNYYGQGNTYPVI